MEKEVAPRKPWRPVVPPPPGSAEAEVETRFVEFTASYARIFPWRGITAPAGARKDIDDGATTAYLKFYNECLNVADMVMMLCEMVRPMNELSPSRRHVLKRAGETELAARLEEEIQRKPPSRDISNFPEPAKTEAAMAIEQRNFVRTKLWQLLELSYCRIMDELMVYLTDLIHDALVSKPDALKSFGRNYSIADFEAAGSIEAMRTKARRDICDSLSRMSIGELAKELKNKLNFRIFEDDDPRAEIEAAITRRNIFVHERGIVSSEKASRLLGTAGTHLVISEDDFFNYRDLAMMWAFRVDVRAEQRFGIPVKSL